MANVRTREAGLMLKPLALNLEFWILVVVIIKMCSFGLGSDCCIKRGSHAKIYFSLISFTNFNPQFLYSLTICMLHYNPRHVSSISMPIFGRTSCIITASGIVTLIRHTVQPFTESDDTRCCDNTACAPEDWHVDARNMSRIVM